MRIIWLKSDIWAILTGADRKERQTPKKRLLTLTLSDISTKKADTAIGFDESRHLANCLGMNNSHTDLYKEAKGHLCFAHELLLVTLVFTEKRKG